MRRRSRSSRRIRRRSVEDTFTTNDGSSAGGTTAKSGADGAHGLRAAGPVFGLSAAVQRKEAVPVGTAQRQTIEDEEAAAGGKKQEEAPELEEEISTSLQREKEDEVEDVQRHEEPEEEDVQRQEEELEEEASSASIRKKSGDGEGGAGADAGGGGVSDLKGRGQALPSTSQSFFGSRFGRDFSRVRIHTEERSADLAERLNARAFTTGRHIVFGRGEYRPGSIEGDTLIAHELAHVAQQRSAPGLNEGSTSSAALETDADESAAGALSAGWSGAKQMWSSAARTTGPRLKSGLRLQRCSKYSKAEKKKIEDTKKILNASATGKEALAIQKKYKVGFEFGSKGTGSYYDPSSNTMRMDAGHPPERAALTFVHEMNHAKYHHEGKQADPKKETRDEYVKKMVTEEAEGVVKSIEAKSELKGKTDFSKIGGYPPLEGEYKKAHDAAIAAAKKADPKKSEAELAAIGREAGRKRVIKGFMKGEITTSTTGETYPDYYGKAWDKVNSASK